jgi:hypothetical protein
VLKVLMEAVELEELEGEHGMEASGAVVLMSDHDIAAAEAFEQSTIVKTVGASWTRELIDDWRGYAVR